MQLSAPLVLILAALGAVEASLHEPRLSRHHGRANAIEAHARRGTGKTGRCKPRPSSILVSTTSTKAPEATHAAPAALNDKAASKDNSNKGSDNKDSDNKSSDNKGADNSNNNNNNQNNSGNKSSGSKNSGSAAGLIKITDSSCGWPGATSDTSPTSGPNGNIDWLNCGVDQGGWRPPFVRVEDLVTQDLGQALNDPNSPFKACAAFLDHFYEAAGTYNLPPILIASIAMQESSCIPSTVGGAGEQGLMQITKDKCGGAPGGNCREPRFNILAGAKFLSNTLNGNGGNLLLTIGQYNGWQPGLTIGSATAAGNGPCCRCQNNLDYLQQLFNYWLQNKNPYTSNPRSGKYHNLDKCPNDY